MKYYKVSEIADIAKVSKRTIQFYDEKDILKPSYLDQSGYRFYSEDKIMKLQKILALKYLGLSLKDIRLILLDDDENMVNSLQLQKNLINQKISELNLIQDSIDMLIENYKHDEVIDWDDLINLTRMLSTNLDIGDYYRNANNLNVRINFHRQFSHNQENWYDWLSKIIELGNKVLELGCGSGELWTYYPAKICETHDITLSDKSAGIVNDAREKLKDYDFSYEVIDINQLDTDNKYDVIIANHVLYFADKIVSVINDIATMCNTFYCTAYSKDHMKEIRTIVQEFDNRIRLTNDKYFEKFDIETAQELLNRHFSSVEYLPYIDYLEVDEVDALVDYVLSCNGNQNQYLQKRLSEFRRFLAEKGTIRISKDVGIFICRK